MEAEFQTVLPRLRLIKLLLTKVILQHGDEDNVPIIAELLNDAFADNEPALLAYIRQVHRGNDI